MSRVLLITGSTGQQGGAVIDALLAQQASNPSSPQPTIVGVTRDPSSASAKALAAKSPLIKLIKGDLADPAPIFKSARDVTSQPVWGVFSVQVPGAQEESQGKALVDAAIEDGVKHFVQTSVDRGGEERSWTNPTYVPHFASKHNIEVHLRDRTAAAGPDAMTWTVLRPVAFMEGLVPGFQSRIFLAVLQNQLRGKPLQWVSTKDVGIFGAKALSEGESDQWKNKAVSIAGDELTLPELVDGLAAKVKDSPTPTWSVLGTALLWGMKEIRLMTNWFGEEGYGADITQCKQINPQMLDLGRWLETRGKFELKQ